MHASSLWHELWEEADGRTMVCLAGPDGEQARSFLGPDARLAWIFEASSHFDAMTQYHKRMGWSAYSTNHACDMDLYPGEWVLRQRAALAAVIGNRNAIAVSRSARAWRSAAEDLDIRFESPFAMELNGTPYWCAGWLRDFGGAKGAIIACPLTVDEIFDVAEELGFYASRLNPYYYEVYDRERFVETLNDWGWFGAPAAAPTWFTGAFGEHGGR